MAASFGDLELTGFGVRSLLASFQLGVRVDVALLARQAPNAELRKARLRLSGLRPRWSASVRPDGLVKLSVPLAEEPEARLLGKKLARMVRLKHTKAAGFKDWQALSTELRRWIFFL